MASVDVDPGTASRRRRVLLVIALVVVLAASVAAYRVVSTPSTTPLEASAAADARDQARALTTELTDLVEDVGDEPWELDAAFAYAQEVGAPVAVYEAVDPGAAEAAWRVQVEGFASWGGGLVSRSAHTVVCVDVVVDRDADPAVRTTDAACLTEPRSDAQLIPVERPR